MERHVYAAFAICILIAGVLSHFASPEPDGLERVAEDKGFMEKSEGMQVFPSPFPDYAIPGIENEKLSASLAGTLGTVSVFVLMFFTGKALSKKKV